MDLSKVKLIVSDMDGTLLNSAENVSEEFFQLYEELKEGGVQFVAASGRQYFSIQQKLNGIKNEIFTIAENGGITLKGEKVLHTNSLPTESIRNIIKHFQHVEAAEIILCGRKRAYVESKNEKFLNLFSEYYSEHIIVENLLEVSDDNFLKIAIFHPENSEKHLYPSGKTFEDTFQVKVSGKNWLDISDQSTHKGNALAKLQQQLNISKAETMVFGDYNNDVEMLQLADFSYAMANAHENVKATAKYQTLSNDERGVEKVLKEVIAAKRRASLQ